jgi:hypothetical protein
MNMKKCIATILAVLMLAVTPLTAYATEVETHTESNANVTFYITDETNGEYPGSAFTAIMTDNTGTITDEYTFSAGNSWGNARYPKYTMTAPATYTVKFEGLDSGYKIIDTLTRSDKITFETTMGGSPQVLWSIVKSESDTAEEETEPTIATQAESNSFTVSDEGADEVYNAFLEATAFIAEDTAWQSNVLAEYSLFENRYATWYASYVENGTEKDFLSMSLYDRFVWGETYLMFAWAVNTGTFSEYFGSEEVFANRITDNLVNRIQNARDLTNGQQVIDAYLALADWQYNYVKESGVPFNFVNNRSYLEEIGEMPETSEETKTDEEELSEAAEELLEDADDKTKEETEKGIWDDTMNALARNIVTVLVFIALVVALVVVIQKRKRLNKDDDTDGDTNVDTTTDK